MLKDMINFLIYYYGSSENKSIYSDIKWKCVESSKDSKCLYYGRFILSQLMKGQGDTIGIAMRRALIGEIEGTCITRAKFEKVKQVLNSQHIVIVIGLVVRTQEGLHLVRVSCLDSLIFHGKEEGKVW